MITNALIPTILDSDHQQSAVYFGTSQTCGCMQARPDQGTSGAAGRRGDSRAWYNAGHSQVRVC